ncbi:MAG: hypothetical protein J5582_07865 [Ruminococcus sp.]|uniref:hypothetical protein n=1 Tax=Ruminococcus sp. TaxID=41978 RepID=UPI0025D77FB1|nr:hypothetical protein [Ruminococcus sp.]MBO4866475.1 hypothetical protein [Ruminococcus sp.]
MKNKLFIIALTATVLLTACGKTAGNDSKKTEDSSSHAESTSRVSEESSDNAENSEESSDAQSESSEESESSMAEKKKEKTKSDSSKASKEKNDSNTTIIINDPTTQNNTANQNGTTTYTNDNTSNYDDSQKQDHTDTKKMFEDALDNVSVEIGEESVVERGVVNGQNYILTIDLSKWDKFTTTEDMVQLSRLFWQSYPKMYERFADITDPPVSVILAIEDEGYAVAEAGGDFVHLHDQWLYSNPEDYDCITHELAHVIQAEWDGESLEYDSFIELFADACRMEYAMDNGYYNDYVWTLQTAGQQDTRRTSVRFLVWLDYMYSNGDIDIMRRFCEACYDQEYSPAEWAQAWQEIFKGTALEGKTVDEAWEMYTSSDFAYLSSSADKGETSDLLQAYDIRERL